MSLELCFRKKVMPCHNCGKPTPFYVVEEQLGWNALVFMDENGRTRVVSELAFKEPDKLVIHWPMCPTCYKECFKGGGIKP